MNADHDPLASRPVTVLVVESDVIIRTAVSAYLRECGFRVVEASSADEAMRVLEADIAVGVVFTEVDVPGAVGGFGLARWLRRERPGVEVILSSGIKRRAAKAGELCEQGPVFTKPYDHRDLERHIRRLLANDRSTQT
jgi:DNA-binding NtrC family response regulator